MSIKTNDYRFLKNGKHHLILSGEVHYFRLPKDSWDQHLELAKSTGINTIATYVPWIIHEEIYRSYDFTHDFDLPFFLSLCKDKNLDVIIKPGPYIMAELKNEGLPYWLYEKYPEIIPNTWNKNKVTTPQVDYLHPQFLNEVKTWYNVLFDHIKDYMSPVIGIQLDNEVGMISWVSNQPELSLDITTSLKDKMPHIKDVYHPSTQESLIYHDTLKTLMRKRYEFYIQTLKSYFEDLGLSNMLYFINIHGTSAGRGKSFPIGISQLIDTYAKDNDILPGMDLYFGNIDLENFHDLYIVNSFVKSTVKDSKPYGTLELNVADGNFGDNLAIHNLPSALDFKIRFAIAQDQKFLNYYLLTAGINPKLKNPKKEDLNQRVAITGARHGFAAPIQTDFSLLYTFDILKNTTQMVQSFSSHLANMLEETDEIAACFMMDSYKTEYQMPNQDIIRQKNDNLSLHRNSVYWDTLLKQMLLLHYQFHSFWLENAEQIPSSIKLLMTNSSTFMSNANQTKFVNYLKSGGKIIFVGDLPEYNLIGDKDTTLIDYLNIKPIKKYFDWEDHLLTLTSDIKVQGQTEFRSFIAQSVETDQAPLFSHLITNEKIGVKSENYVWITSNYPGHLLYTKTILDHLQIKPKIFVQNQSGHLLTFKQSYDETSLYHLINLEHYPQSLKIYDHDFPLFDSNPVSINAQEALMLWTNIQINEELFIYSTAEIKSYTNDSYLISINQKNAYIKIKTHRSLTITDQINVIKRDHVYEITVVIKTDQVILNFA